MSGILSRGVCRGCQAAVLWIQTVAKRMMICNPELKVSDGTNPKLALITKHGVTLQNPAKGEQGYTPHWATCAQAKDFKTPKTKEKPMPEEK